MKIEVYRVDLDLFVRFFYRYNRIVSPRITQSISVYLHNQPDLENQWVQVQG